MARGSKVTFNRAKLDEVTLALADGLFAVGQEIVNVARPPDSPYDPYPTGEGLPKQGGVLVYANGKKVAGWSQRGTQPKAPRSARVTRSKGFLMIVGWGFPARFNEFGTIRNRAQPFFTPAVTQVLPRSAEIMRPVVSGKLGKV